MSRMETAFNGESQTLEKPSQTKCIFITCALIFLKKYFSESLILFFRFNFFQSGLK